MILNSKKETNLTSQAFVPKVPPTSNITNKKEVKKTNKADLSQDKFSEKKPAKVITKPNPALPLRKNISNKKP